MRPIRHLPPEGTDPVALARHHCEAALDAMAQALEAAHASHLFYDLARAEFIEASYWCAEAVAVLYAAQEAEHRARGEALREVQGLAPRAQSHRPAVWIPTQELEEGP